MIRYKLTGAAAALLLSAGIAVAQQKGSEDAPGSAAPEGRSTKGTAEKAQPEGKSTKGTAEKVQPEGKSTKGTAEKAQPEGKSTKGTAEKAEPEGKSTKGTAEKAQPGDKSTKGTAEKAQPGDKSTKGTAEKAQPEGKSTKGTAERAEPEGKSTKGTAEKAQPEGKSTKDAAGKQGDRVQVSEQQRTNVSQVLRKEKQVNRVSDVNVSVTVGTRVPRSVSLAVLPASVVSIVPAYRSYRYFVVDDRLCIVDPATYEIVDVIVVAETTAGGSSAPAARLTLTNEEKEIILSEIEIRGGSTLALGALAEGSEVPQGIELRVFPDRVVQKVPKVKGYRFVAVEDRIAIVEPRGDTVQLVIERDR